MINKSADLMLSSVREQLYVRPYVHIQYTPVYKVNGHSKAIEMH